MSKVLKEKYELENFIDDEPADFQKAVSTAGFGKFNWILLLIFIPSSWVSQFNATIMSFVIPAAACDLNMTLSQKSWLNSMSLIGMVSSALFWGFLQDTLGRRKVILICNGIEIFLVIGSGLSQTYTQLLVFQLFGGLITGGLLGALNTYIQEYHATKHRGKIQMAFACFYCSAFIVLPLTGSIFLKDIHFKIFNSFDLYGWNIFILSTSIPSIFAFVSFFFMEETPKFLMSAGRNEEALEIFRKMYSQNTGESMDSFPITKLIDEIPEVKEPKEKRSLKQFLQDSWRQFSPLFGRTHLPMLVLCSFILSMFQMGTNAIRMYMPQIYQAEHDLQLASDNQSDVKLCSILEFIREKPTGDDVQGVCEVNLHDNFEVYFNSIINAFIATVMFAISGCIINKLGRRNLLYSLGTLCIALVGSMYFSQNSITTLALGSVYLGAVNACYDVTLSVIIVIFPTTLRALAISICLIFGRLMSVVGNLVFPILVQAGCAPPFFGLAGCLLITLLFSCLLPKADNMDLK